MTRILGPRDKAVYAWERAVIDPLDQRALSDAEVRAIVPWVWSQLGLMRPPAVEIKMIPDGGWGDRTKITLRPGMNHRVLLHEMAHAMNLSLEASVGAYELRPEGEDLNGSSHDDNWLGLYVELLDRFLPQVNKLWLYKTLKDFNLTVSYAPKPRCI